MSKADEQTEKARKLIEDYLKDLYSEAEEANRAEYDRFVNGWDSGSVHHKGIAERYAAEFEAYENGAYTEQQFRDWQLTQIARGEGWKESADRMALRLTTADQQAAAYINGKTPNIYTINANYDLQFMNRRYGIDLDLVNEEMVRDLVMGTDNFTEFRTVRVDPQRDYSWNWGRVQRALTSGIIQGKSVYAIASDFQAVTGSNYKAALRNARTAITSAQNGGRFHAAEKLEKEYGMEVQKKWISTVDERTRESHVHLNGVIVPLHSRFPNGLMRPGDPDGAPAEVYNSRCNYVNVLPQYNGAKRIGG